MESTYDTLDILTPRELAAYSGWPEKRIRQLLRDGKLRHLRIGSNFYLPRNAIEEFISDNMVAPSVRPCHSTGQE